MISHVFKQFAQSGSGAVDPNASPNVVPVTTSDPTVNTAGLAGAGAFLIIISILGVVNLVFFIITIIHLIKNPDVPNRTLWIVLALFLPFASWFYVFGPRRSYNKAGGGQGQVAGAGPQGHVATPPPASPYSGTSPAGVGVTAGTFGATAPAAPQTFGSQAETSPTVAQAPVEPQTPVTPPTFSEPPTVAAAPENPVSVVEPAPSFQPQYDNQVVTPTAPQIDDQTPTQGMPSMGSPEITHPEDENNTHPNGQA